MRKYLHPLRGLLLAGALFIPASRLLAQDPELSQFYASPVYTNPAMAGAGICGGRLSANYRNQWPNLPGSFVTQNFSFDQYAPKLGGGIGLMLTKDVAGQGLLSTHTFSGVYSYRMRVKQKLFINASVQASVVQKSIDWSKLTFADMIDPIKGFVYPTNEPKPDPTSKFFPNFSTGFLAYTEKFYAGLAIHNITQPNQSFFNTVDAILPRRYTLHGGTTIPLKKNGRREPESSISPNVLFMLQDRFTQINLGFYVNKNAFVTGLWFRQGVGYFRTSDALVILAGFRKEYFKFAYSYDITVSDGRSAAPGSHEVSIAYEWCNRVKKPGWKDLKCFPRF